MRVGTNGIVVNQFGHVLLMKRDDIRTWAIPGGGLEAGELPPDSAAREVEEETGQRAHPVRLVGVYYWQNRFIELLSFSFRCLPAGGEIKKSEESLAVGYADPNELPRMMLGLHRERLEIGLSHDGGPPYWGRQGQSPITSFLLTRIVLPVIYGWKDLRRKQKNQPPFQPAPEWETGAFVIIQDEAGRVLWVKRRDYDVWNLPGGRSEPGEAPWETAVREATEETGLDVRLKDLTGVYIKSKEQGLIFAFSATVTGGELQTNPEAAAFAYFCPGDEPENSVPKHSERVADGVDPDRQITRFREQDGSPGLESLGLK